MKKLLTIAALITAGTISYGQGVVVFNSASIGILTNTASSVFQGGNQSGGVSGKTATTPGGFQYALFIQTYTGSLSSSATNPIANGWTLAAVSGSPIVGTNGTSVPTQGGILGNGAASGVAVDGWALPSSTTYNTAGHEYFMIAGWSTTLGTSWSSIATQLASGFTANGFFGVSKIGDSYAGGANGLTAQSLFSANAQTLTPVTTFTLYSVAPAPEPGTMALAALGGASLLLFRRRK